MLVMAVEGVRQLAPLGRPITGYLIKDATFTKAIPISANPDESTEVELFIRSGNNDEDSEGSSWSEFRICVFKNGRWLETCSGNIRAEFEEVQNNVRVDNEQSFENRKLSHILQGIQENVTTCERTMATDQVYKHFAASGIEYGPAFQRLRNLHYNNQCQVNGTIDLFQWRAVENTNHYQPHVVHPTSFDSLAQLLYLTMSDGAQHRTRTAVPTRVDKVWISSTGLSYPDVSSVSVAGAAYRRGFRQVVGSAFASNPTTGDIVATIENMEFTALEAQDSVSNVDKGNRNLFFRLEWMPSLFQPNDTKVWEYCKQAKGAPLGAVRTAVNEDMYRMLYGFIDQALKDVETTPMMELKPHLQKYISWMKQEFERGERNQPFQSRNEWKSSLQDKKRHEALCSKMKLSVEGKFLAKIGGNLSQILRGNVDPLDIFFKDNLVGEYYTFVNETLISFDPVGRYLEIMSHADPHLNILEIGAGTGATTKKILASLSKESTSSGFSHYSYTDISSFFFEAAKKQFHDYSPRLEFNMLNIENDPLEQGFEAGSYDVIAAALVSQVLEPEIA
jgi:hypothetical protein